MALYFSTGVAFHFAFAKSHMNCDNIILSDLRGCCLSRKTSRNSELTYLSIGLQVQQGLVAVPKSVTKSRIQENIDIFNFELSEVDVNYMNSFNQNLRVCHRDQ
jgi:hypothetical protein